ncbi:UNVERIFIED_CONTAM: hypothetical protein FKN15_031553 [Acipenser sinensis]
MLKMALQEMRQQQQLEELAHPQLLEVCTPNKLKATREIEEDQNIWVQVGRCRGYKETSSNTTTRNQNIKQI